MPSDQKPRFRDIPQFPRANWECDVGWDFLEEFIDQHAEYGLDLNPDFQRAHVWTRDQQVAYVEYCLRGGEVGRNLTFNCPGWSHIATQGMGPYVIVDGKQRLEAIRAFMRDDFPAFGFLHSQYSGRIAITTTTLRWRVCELATRQDLLELYLSINAGGTPHTKEELDRVRALLEEAKQAGT